MAYQSLAGEAGLPAALLRRHRRRGAEQAVLAALGDVVGGEAEVEDDDAAAGGDEHVRRLEVAVQLAGGVQGADAGRQLQGRRWAAGRSCSRPAA